MVRKMIFIADQSHQTYFKMFIQILIMFLRCLA